MKPLAGLIVILCMVSVVGCSDSKPPSISANKKQNKGSSSSSKTDSPEATDFARLSCATAACHGDIVLPSEQACRPGTEFTYFHSYDPHAASPQTLELDVSKKMIVALATTKEEHNSWKKTCQSCHAPPERNNGRHGFGCVVCHPAAEKQDWIDTHHQKSFQRSKYAATNRTQSLSTRASLCVECHVGTKNKEVNHDMIAAGHPALKFELAGYSELLPKHWSDARERRAIPDFELRLWLNGQLSSAKAALQLLSARLDKGDKHVWPEFAEFDCFRCHQHILGSGWRGEPSPVWGSWYFWLADLSPSPSNPLTNAFATAKAFRTSKSDMKAWAKATPDQLKSELEELQAAVDNLPKKLRTWLDISAAKSATAAPPEASLEAQHLSTAILSMDPPKDWDGATQRYLALATIEQSLRDRGLERDATIIEKLRQLRRLLEFVKDRGSPTRGQSNSGNEARRNFSKTQSDLLDRLRSARNPGEQQPRASD